jgi:hypothetical protein
MAKLSTEELQRLSLEDTVQFKTPSGEIFAFRKPGMTDMSGPYQDMLEKDPTIANKNLLKSLCLTHDGQELETLWNRKYAYYLLPLKGVMASLTEGLEQVSKKE